MDTYQGLNIIYCPKCQNKLDHKGNLAACGACGFNYYQNPAPCTVIMFYKDGQVLMGKRAIEPRINTWDLPGGFIEVGETAEEGAIREALEETGLEVKISKYLGSAPDIYGETLVPTLVFCFLVEVISGEMMPQDDISELRWFDLNSTPDEVAFPTVKTCLGMLKTYLAKQ